MPDSKKYHPNYEWNVWLNWYCTKLTWSSKSLQWMEYVLVGCGVIVALLGGLLQYCDPTGQGFTGWRKDLIVEVYSRRLSIFIVLTIIQVACWIAYYILKWLRPLDLEKAKAVLNELVNHHFPDQNKVEFVYRATLFTIRGWAWWRQWLGIVCRSGETLDRSCTIFSIDSMRSANNTGFAGRCFYAEGATIVYPHLLPSTDPDKYKEACGLDDKEFCRLNVPSCVVMVTGIKKNGKMWGVLVLDSNDAAKLPLPSATARLSANWHKAEIARWAYTLNLLVD